MLGLSEGKRRKEEDFSAISFFSDGWKMNVSLKRQLQRSLIKNKSVAFADSNSSGISQNEIF